MERDGVTVNTSTIRLHFNSHAHVERDGRLISKPKQKPYFNSHAHVERDMQKRIIRQNSTISTHTLTWSVTSALDANCDISSISTHTLTWSVTWAS